MTEPTIVVANREHLWWLLVEASELEHMIMCQYLFAEFTLKNGTADGLTVEQAEAVERWRKTISGIAVEEMLHLALVCNLLTAIGAAPTFSRPNFPQLSGYFPSRLQLDLLPFGEQALRQFLYLERPEGMEREPAEGFVPTAPPRAALTPEEAMPRGQEYDTVGRLYRGVANGLRGLVSSLGESGVFIGPPRAQATPERFQWPQLIAVTDLASALAAVEEIIEQGEGARGDWKDAHYGRFLAIWEEYNALKERDPSFEPARSVVPAFSRQPFDVRDERILITDPGTARVAEVAALAYEVVLQLLLRFFTHTTESEDELGILIDTAIDTMASVLRPVAIELTTLPVGDSAPGRNAGFAFEMFYIMSNAVPWQKPAWTVIFERASMLAAHCAEVASSVPALAAPAEAAASIAGKLSTAISKLA